ncbi:hypothetical protein NicSoilE8_41670 (plasmid) [Arthrobacter sp. NicSoilE8]|nr:hypothetical protein NicSoilE8_41670 [Arthrobacter sp. NicSoilE8]
MHSSPSVKGLSGAGSATTVGARGLPDVTLSTVSFGDSGDFLVALGQDGAVETVRAFGVSVAAGPDGTTA